MPNVDKESGERDELLSVEFVCWTLDLPVRLFTDSAADEWRRRWYRSGGCGDNAVTAVKLLRGSGRKMDPLSVLGTAETILTEVNRIGDFVDAVKTNTKKCKALWERVQRLEEIAEGLKQHPERLSSKQIESIMTVVESVEATVGKYYSIKRAMKLIFAVPMKGEFADVNEALDSVL